MRPRHKGSAKPQLETSYNGDTRPYRRRHMQSGEKYYSCSICHGSGTWLDDMKKHVLVCIIKNRNKCESIRPEENCDTIINDKNDSSENIKERMQLGHKAFYDNRKLLQDKEISIKTKIKIYKTLIRDVVTRDAKVMCMTETEEETLRNFERRIFKMIHGISHHEKVNCELQQEIEGSDIVRFIKVQRLRWLGHIIRSDEETEMNSIIWNESGDRAKMRWVKEVKEDLKKLDIKDWWYKSKFPEEWKKIVQKAKHYKKL